MRKRLGAQEYQRSALIYACAAQSSSEGDKIENISSDVGVRVGNSVIAKAKLCEPGASLECLLMGRSCAAGRNKLNSGHVHMSLRVLQECSSQFVCRLVRVSRYLGLPELSAGTVDVGSCINLLSEEMPVENNGRVDGEMERPTCDHQEVI
jgi:hypothetical protein